MFYVPMNVNTKFIIAFFSKVYNSIVLKFVWSIYLIIVFKHGIIIVYIIDLFIIIRSKTLT